MRYRTEIWDKCHPFFGPLFVAVVKDYGDHGDWQYGIVVEMQSCETRDEAEQACAQLLALRSL